MTWRGDVLKPDWDNAGRVHDWRNYVTERVREMWATFHDDQKEAIAEMADNMASQEDWT